MVNVLNKYKAISFDCYGTLIDWETGIWDAAQILLMKNLSAKIDKDLFLTEFAYWETEIEKKVPIPRKIYCKKRFLITPKKF